MFKLYSCILSRCQMKSWSNSCSELVLDKKLLCFFQLPSSIWLSLDDGFWKRQWLKLLQTCIVMKIFFLFLEPILINNIFRTNSLDAHYFGEVKQHLISITLLEHWPLQDLHRKGAKGKLLMTNFAWIMILDSSGIGNLTLDISSRVLVFRKCTRKQHVTERLYGIFPKARTTAFGFGSVSVFF